MMQGKYLENYLHYGYCELIDEKKYQALCFTLFDPETDDKEEIERDIIWFVKKLTKKYNLTKKAFIFDIRTIWLES
jgi:hypothetical protein